MKILRSLLGSALLCLTSCTFQNDVTSKVVTLTGEALPVQGEYKEINVEMLRPSRIYTVGNKLVVFDEVKEKMFKVFRLPSLEYAYAFGNRGDGPDDFQMIDKECVNVVGDCLEILHRKKILRYQVTDTAFVKVEPTEYTENLVLTQVSPLNNFKQVSEQVYVYNNNDLSDNMELCLNNLTTKNETKFGKLTSEEQAMEDQDKSMYFFKSICASSEQKRFATCYYFRPAFKIYDEQAELLKNVTVNHPDIKAGSTDMMYFTDSFATPDHIYMMWVGKSKEEVVKDLDAFRPEILIFDWEGNIIRRLKLDRPVITCGVSEENGELYAVSFLEEDTNKIWKFKLPSL